MQPHEINEPPPDSNKPDHNQVHFLDEEDSVQLGMNSPRGEVYGQLVHTILADATSNRKFMAWQVKITLLLILLMLFFKALPSPLIINIIENDPQVFTQEKCSDKQTCSDVEEGYESIVIKKVNPFQRELKYFVKLNFQKYEQMKAYFGNKQVDLNDEITWIEIYAYRNGQKYGPVIYQKNGEDIYQVLFDNQALIFVGEVHVLEQLSYLIKIYKLIKTYKVPKLRLLDIGQQSTNSTQQSLPSAIQPTQNTSNSTTGESNIKQQKNITDQRNNSKEDNIKPIEQPKIIPKQEPKEKPVQQQKYLNLSIPLTVEMVRYSGFYTAVQLIIRYVTLLVILYVRGQTPQSPKIFHYILILTANPLIFIEVAFPNTVSNIISTVCSSMYVAYLGVFLYYCHRKLINSRVDCLVKVIKILAFLGLWIASIMRQLHLVNQTKVQFFQSILIVLVLLPLVHHLWKLYFLKSRTILHRNMLFIYHTVYYLLLLFFSGYLVNYGWKKISFYFIVQIYGCELCYLTSPYVGKMQDADLKLKLEQDISQPFSNPQMATHKITEEKEGEAWRQQEHEEQFMKGQPQQKHPSFQYVFVQ